MIDFYKNIKSFIKLGTVHTDNNVFKLHYKVTVILLATCSVLLTSKQYFGEPIDCDVEQRKEVIDTFCWIHGTFIVNENLIDTRVPGLGLPQSQNETTNYQTYYQWVCIVFALQAVLFYVPRYLWKACEGGRLNQIIGEFGGPLTPEKWNSVTKDKLVKNILSGSYIHNIYTFRYCCCEILNFINVVINIYFMDWLVNGQFSYFGIAHASYNIVNPVNKIFPKMAKCIYYKYGPSGDVQWLDALCILPLNVLNQKVFLILWYWFFILLLITFLNLLYRGLFLFVPVLRLYLLRAQARKLEKKKAKLIVKKLSAGDFFILYKIGKNVNPTLYKEIVNCVYDHLVTRGSYKNFLQDV